MKKTVFVRIDYDAENTNITHIENAIESLFEMTPEIKRKYYEAENEEHAEYVVYSLEDNPI